MYGPTQSAVHLHLKDKAPSFEDNNVEMLDREDRWCEREVKEKQNIYVKCGKNNIELKSSHLSNTYKAALNLQLRTASQPFAP